MKAKRKTVVEQSEGSRPTIMDVAKQSGFSVATVSRVLNGQSHHISDEAKDKVRLAVQALGYVPHHKIQQVPAAAPSVIGLTSVSMSTEPFPALLEGVTEALHAANARPVICPIPRRHNCNMPLLERFMNTTTSGGLILGSAESDETIQEAMRSGFPCVVIYPDMPTNENIPVVASSDWKSARLATEHLLDLRHTRIGVIKNVVTYVSQDRFSGFQSALLAADIPISPELIYESREDSREVGYEAGKYFLSLPEPPTAIFALRDVVAMGVIKAAHELNVAIPDKLSLVGFDDLESAPLVTPELTTIRPPFTEMGRVGVDMLLRLIEGKRLDVTRVELTGRLILRASTAPASG